jgi:hypothetical protein
MENEKTCSGAANPANELIDALERRVSEQAKTIEGLMTLLKRLSAGAAEESSDESSDDSGAALLYAVYKVEAPAAGGVFVAVCVDNPFLYAVSHTQEGASSEIRKKVREFYGCADSGESAGGCASGGRTLEGITIPDSLPEDF